MNNLPTFLEGNGIKLFTGKIIQISDKNIYFREDIASKKVIRILNKSSLLYENIGEGDEIAIVCKANKRPSFEISDIIPVEIIHEKSGKHIYIQKQYK